MSKYVVKSWEVSKEKDSKGNYVNILFRRAGFFHWLFGLIGIDRTISLKVNNKSLRLKEWSWSIEKGRAVILSEITSIDYRYNRPWIVSLLIFLFFSVPLIYVRFSGYLAFLAFAGKAGKFISDLNSVIYVTVILLIGLLIAFIYYYLNISTSFAVYDAGGRKIGIKIKNSVIERVAVSASDSSFLAYVVRQLVLYAKNNNRE